MDVVTAAPTYNDCLINCHSRLVTVLCSYTYTSTEHYV